jgi:hypothetical protein
MLLHDNARPLAAARTQAMLQDFGLGSVIMIDSFFFFILLYS